MVKVRRHADVVWQGDLEHGGGEIGVGSGALDHSPISWASRSQKPEGRTSPEELIAAAHAACYAMPLSRYLTQAGGDVERLQVVAECAIQQRDDGLTITAVDLDVKARVDGLDRPAFERTVDRARERCPSPRR